MDDQAGNGEHPHPNGRPSAAQLPAALPDDPAALAAAPTTAGPRAQVGAPQLRQALGTGPQPPGDPALDGTLAMYLERVANRAAAAFSASAAVIALIGDDRRCFIGGSTPPLWLSRDPGALIRSRACTGVLESGDLVAVENATAPAAPWRQCPVFPRT